MMLPGPYSIGTGLRQGGGKHCQPETDLHTARAAGTPLRIYPAEAGILIQELTGSSGIHDQELRHYDLLMAAQAAAAADLLPPLQLKSSVIIDCLSASISGITFMTEIAIRPSVVA